MINIFIAALFMQWVLGRLSSNYKTSRWVAITVTGLSVSRLSYFNMCNAFGSKYLVNVPKRFSKCSQPFLLDHI